MGIWILVSSKAGDTTPNAPSVLLFLLFAFYLFQAKVAHPDHRLGAEPCAFNDVGGTTCTENLATNAAMVLSPPRSEDAPAIVTIVARFVRHPIVLAEAYHDSILKHFRGPGITYLRRGFCESLCLS